MANKPLHPNRRYASPFRKPRMIERRIRRQHSSAGRKQQIQMNLDSPKTTLLKAMAVVLCAVCSESVTLARTTRYGTSLSPREWTAPEQCLIAGGGGQVAVMKQRRTVVERVMTRDVLHEVELLVTGDGREVWLGRPCPRYAMVSGKIWGVDGDGMRFWIAKSEHVPETANGAEAVIEAMWQRFLDAPDAFLWDDHLEGRFDLWSVFGVPGGPFRSAVSTSGYELSNLEPRGDAIVMQFHSIGGFDVSLTLGANQELLDASRKGRPFPLLCEGRPAFDPSQGFDSAGVGRVACAGGFEEAVQSMRRIVTSEDSRIRVSDTKAVALIADGRTVTQTADHRNV